ncbi:alpha/beta fold hydrolase [Phenylobacterium sp.]|uniref:alpha/beta fold hydrolase n=1 Tax=Phenylobacterium sp. TaxID=1871053 RepID=UPI0027359C21|nr:alpha/beta fold hydrolase [Phenylobacterium sp.]MDP3660531.1 hypothetical protein [Phenylobacterium sp.]
MVRTFVTRHGPVPIWGEFDQFDSIRPLLFVVRGAFPDADSMTLLHRQTPDVDVVLAHLPGMHSPFFDTCTIQVFAEAFDEIVRDFGRRINVVFGLSTGALTALAMRTADRLILVEPPLSTAEAWPLIAQFREWALADADVARWVEGLFGYSQTDVVNRDYTGLLADSAPGVVILGETPLEPPRAFDRMPSLVSAADRKRIAAAPHLTEVIVPGVGHNIPGVAPYALLDEIKRILADVQRR